MKQVLNLKQFKRLVADLISSKVKRLGQYKFRKYNISIYKQDVTGTGTQRVMALYQRRKEKGLCIQCGKKSKKYVRCESCREKANEARRKYEYEYY